MPTLPLGDLLHELADQIHDELAATVTTDYGDDLQVIGRMNYDPTPPSIDIYPPLTDLARDPSTAGFRDIAGAVLLTVRVRVLTADHEAGQDLLLRFMDEEDDLSLAAAIEGDQTLNGYASAIEARGPSGFTRYPDSGGEGDLLGVEWNVRLLRVTS